MSHSCSCNQMMNKITDVIPLLSNKMSPITVQSTYNEIIGAAELIRYTREFVIGFIIKLQGKYFPQIDFALCGKSF